MTQFDPASSIQSLLQLLAYIGYFLLALGCWRMFLVTRRKPFMIAVIGVGVTCLVQLFWWLTSAAVSMIPSLYEVMRPFYENEVLTNIPGLLGLAANAAIYLSLAWEFTQRLQKTQPSAPES